MSLGRYRAGEASASQRQFELSIARPHSTMSGQQLEQAMAMLQAMQKEQQARDELMSEVMSKLELRSSPRTT